MKLAWIVYDDDDDQYPVIKFEEPERGHYAKVIPIVYTELVTGK